MEIYPSINVYNKKLESCCDNPKTGFFRNGMCDTCKEDVGIHTVCILATEDFLTFSKMENRGIDPRTSRMLSERSTI